MIAYVVRALICMYQWMISPFLGTCCRYYPSCSQYVSDCFSKYPTTVAAKKSTLRLLSCHPWSQGGVDLP